MPNKIMTTNRILLPSGYVIYCSCDIIREVRPMIERVNQRYAPLRGEGYNVGAELKRLSKTAQYQEHFPKSSRRSLSEGF